LGSRDTGVPEAMLGVSVPMVLILELAGYQVPELAQRAVNGLAGRAGVVSGDNRRTPNQLDFQGAMDVEGSDVVGAIGIGQVSLNASDPVAKLAQHLRHNRFQVFAHRLATVDVRVCVQQNLHVGLRWLVVVKEGARQRVCVWAGSRSGFGRESAIKVGR
jgi:hypothetical protein